MTCPICDQKPMNCDCTETEKRQWAKIEDLRLTDAEREAVEAAIECCEDITYGSPDEPEAAATLRGLLERLK